jgi:hypothetical protein
MTCPWSTLRQGDCLKLARSIPERSVDLVFTSPPYEGQRTYRIGFRLRGQAWVDWLAERIIACARLCRGLVIVNMSSPVKDGAYSAAVEWLVTDLTRVHGLVCGPSPYAWCKSSGIPGSGGKHYHRRNWEPIYAFCLPDRLPLVWSNNLDETFAKRPKWAPGGEMSNRLSDGRRVNQWGGGPKSTRTRRPNGERQEAGRPSHRTHTKRKVNGEMETQEYDAPVLANPGNVIKTHVGGGHLGDNLAHKNEAPMPVELAERFVRWYCPPEGLVLDPFMGGGTTGKAALEAGRKFLGWDIRPEMVALATERLELVTPSMWG